METTINPLFKIADGEEVHSILKINRIRAYGGRRGGGINKFPIKNFFRYILRLPLLKPKREHGYSRARVEIWFDGSYPLRFHFRSDESARKFMQQFLDDVAEKFGSRGTHLCKDFSFTPLK